MTVFGPDISNNRPNFPVADLPRQGYVFMHAKCTEGTDFRDLWYDRYRQAAKEAGLLFAAAHALHKGNAAAQADWFCANIGDKSIPGVVDFEPFGDNPTRGDAVTFVRRCKKNGVRVTLDYLPHWYWLGLALRGLLILPKLISSAYPDQSHDYPSKVYSRVGGDKGTGWARYGGRKPLFWQFTDNAKIDGYADGVDVSAFRGTREQLAATGVFKDYDAPKPPAPKPKPPQPKPAPHEPNIDRARAALTEALKQHPKHGPVHRAVQAALNDLKGI